MPVSVQILASIDSLARLPLVRSTALGPCPLPDLDLRIVSVSGVSRKAAEQLVVAFLQSGAAAFPRRPAFDKTWAITVCSPLLVIQQLAAEKVRRGLLGGKQGLGAEAIEVCEEILRRLPSPSEPRSFGALEAFGLNGLGTRTLIMGILNVTPDSFSDGGLHATVDDAVRRAEEMVHEGAHVIDIGGESTRPGSAPVDEQEELRRVLPVIAALRGRIGAPISIDTYKASVARAAIDAGASIINDISAASFDPAMPALIADTRCPAILMHMKGTPRDMQSSPEYRDVVAEIIAYLGARVEALVAAGAGRELLIVDPGFGFGKTVEHNLDLLRRLREFTCLGLPILVGTSRKATIGKILGDIPVGERLHGTSATVAAAIVNGADIVRVHDVKEMAMVAKMTDAIFRP